MSIKITKLPVYVAILCCLAFYFQSCKPEEMLKKAPEVKTNPITAITDSTAVCGGEVLSNGASEVLSRGVCWGFNSQPTLEENKTVDGSGLGVFTSNIIGLVENTTYFFRAYATNSAGVGYGEDVTFITSSIPVVNTADVTDISSTSATCGGTVISDGTLYVSERGVCWSETPNPTINDDRTIDGTGLGSYWSFIVNLTENKTYYVRAYATNAAGTGYGQERIFTAVFSCGQNFRDNRDGAIYSSVLIGSQCWMKKNLNYGTFVLGATGQSASGVQKYCQKDNMANCATLGGMYVWNEIMNGESSCNGTGETQPACNNPVQGICPDGWHIPSHYEWTVLEKVAGTSPDLFVFDEITSGMFGVDEGHNLKMNGSQYWMNEGKNLLGFDGLAGGYYLGVYGHMGDRAKWWTSTESGPSNAWHRGLYRGSPEVYRFNIGKDYAFSLRCIKND